MKLYFTIAFLAAIISIQAAELAKKAAGNLASTKILTDIHADIKNGHPDKDKLVRSSAPARINAGARGSDENSINTMPVLQNEALSSSSRNKQTKTFNLMAEKPDFTRFFPKSNQFLYDNKVVSDAIDEMVRHLTRLKVDCLCNKQGLGTGRNDDDDDDDDVDSYSGEEYGEDDEAHQETSSDENQEEERYDEDDENKDEDLEDEELKKSEDEDEDDERHAEEENEDEEDEDEIENYTDEEEQDEDNMTVFEEEQKDEYDYEESKKQEEMDEDEEQSDEIEDYENEENLESILYDFEDETPLQTNRDFKVISSDVAENEDDVIGDQECDISDEENEYDDEEDEVSEEKNDYDDEQNDEDDYQSDETDPKLIGNKYHRNEQSFDEASNIKVLTVEPNEAKDNNIGSQ